MGHVTQALSDLRGKVAVVTGANSGIGYGTARALAARGATVVLACRSEQRAAAAIEALAADNPAGRFEFVALDLADLSSVRDAATSLTGSFDRLDILVNNAGVALAPMQRTADDFELHFGANFLGHFALTGLLLEHLMSTPDSRVVHVGSVVLRVGRMNFDDPGFTSRRYRPIAAYGQSKIATLMFMLELDERLRAAGSTTISVAAHPGAAMTSIADDFRIVAHPRMRRLADVFVGSTMNTPELAPEPIIHAAADPDVTGGTYYGPGDRLELRGPTTLAHIPRRATRAADRTRLWDLAASMTSVNPPLVPASD